MESLPLTTPPAAPRPDRTKRALTIGASLFVGALVGAVLLTSGSAAAPLRLSDSSKEGVTARVNTGQAITSIPTGIGNDLQHAFKSNPLYFDPTLRNHVKLAVTPSNENCGASGKELIRPFYVNSASQDGDPTTFTFCSTGTCHLSLEMGAPQRKGVRTGSL